ncbi:hypothetical protein KUW18_03820 [Halomonas sp. DP5Y7-2]|uniref:hypothetical protein n=1 Tax=Halomonas sp. DP5Y7-2 TaxID=2859076 RepID=UPI001C99434C|nr:hypothetical protein [Halomonas sp. DP5Y7-2]MBY5983211.1 hypothetical protein [Halomonas sp. DP5Y7-2]MED5295799.1 hypothetical protein [Pseudomonadota bacterium]
MKLPPRCRQAMSPQPSGRLPARRCRLELMWLGWIWRERIWLWRVSRGLLLTILLLYGSQGSAADALYRRVERHGGVTYSDRPLEGGERFVPGALSHVPSAPLPPALSQLPGDISAAAPGYLAREVLAIARPASGSVLPSGAGGSLEVAAAVSPPLDAGYVLGLEVDGVLVTTGDSPLTLTQLERGEHRIVLVVIDPDRKVRQRSDAVVLHVQRARVAVPATSRHGPSS